MFDNIITCPWKHGQLKDGVDIGAFKIVEYIKSNYCKLNYIDIPDCNESNELYNQKLFEQHINCIGNTLCIGGDHSIAIGSVLSSLFKNKLTCVIWIDAHPDIHTILSSKSGNIHGMPLSFITGLEDRWKWVNSLNFLKFEHLYYFGIREFDDFELKVIKSKKIKILQNIDDIYNVIENYDNIHISFDVDSIDPSYIPSTGTTAEYGIELSEIIDMNKYIKGNNYYNNKTINYDIVEYNPIIGSDCEKNLSRNNIILIIDSLF